MRNSNRYRPYRSNTGEMLIMAKPYFELNDIGQLQLRHSPVPKEPIPPEKLSKEEQMYVDQGGKHPMLRKVINTFSGRVKNLAQKVTQYQPVPAYDEPTHPDWLLMKAILHRWFAETKTPVLLMPIPLYQFIEETSSPVGYQSRFKELENPPSVHIHDPLPFLLQFSEKERRNFRFKTDIHPTPTFHRALAESLSEPIRNLMAQSASY